MNDFPCTQCGACCKSITGIDFLKDFDRGDGQCTFLDEQTNLCTNYDERPLLCNIDRAFNELFVTQLSKESYYELNARACNELQKKHSIDETFRVKI